MTSDTAVPGFSTIPITQSPENRASLEIAWIGVCNTEPRNIDVETREIHQASFLGLQPGMDGIREGLVANGWKLREHLVPFSEIPAESTVLVIDEMFNPLISHINDEQFQALQRLIDSNCRLLWVTMG